MALNPAPVIRRVIVYPTPVISDVIFYEMRESRLPVHQTPPDYGAPHPDVNKYPKHKLVHVTAADDAGWQRWYYAADRSAAEQDTYNYDLRDTEEFTRTYVFPRNAVPDPPEGGSYDPVFQDYAFVGRSIKAAEDPLGGLYVIVYNRFIQAQTVSVNYESNLDCMVRTTKMVVKKGGYVVDDGQSYVDWNPRVEPGLVIELQPGNTVHDVLIKQEIILPSNAEEGSTIQWSLPPVPTFVNYSFPSRLDSVTLVYAWAYAGTGSGQPAFEEDHYYDYQITDAVPGPYAATLRRFVTEDPAAITGTLNLNVVPSPKRETVGVVYSWWYSGDSGNKATAYAKQIVIPSSVHGPITIGNVDAPLESSSGGSPVYPPTPPAAQKANYTTTTLARTPGFPLSNNFSSVNFPEGLDVAAQVRQLSLGLYEVTITTITLPDTGIYHTPV